MASFRGSFLTGSHWATGFVVLTTLLLAGCGVSEPYRVVETQSGNQYDDIPVPAGFEYDSKSWDYVGFPPPSPVAMRSCELIYWGDRTVQRLADWYMEQMPLAGWQHVRTDEVGTVHMHFQKGIEKAEIILNRRVAADRNGYITRITARLGVS